MIDLLLHFLSKKYPRTSNIRITWEVFRNANSLTPPQTLIVGSSDLCFKKLSK